MKQNMLQKSIIRGIESSVIFYIRFGLIRPLLNSFTKKKKVKKISKNKEN